jgi:hypothetical protein
MKVADICLVSHVGFCVYQKRFHCGNKALRTQEFFYKADDYLVDYETDNQQRDN